MGRVPLFNALVATITLSALVVTTLSDGFGLSFWLMLVIFLVNGYLVVDEYRKARR